MFAPFGRDWSETTSGVKVVVCPAAFWRGGELRESPPPVGTRILVDPYKLKGDLSSYEKPDGRIKFDAKASSSGLKAGNAGIYFPGAVSKAAGWKELGWFGNYWDKEFPWIYHQTHGWLYAGGSGGASMWLYDIEMGWWWTNEQYYPFVYMNELKEWVYFRSSTNSVLRFFFRFNAQGGEWKTFPKSGQN